MIANHVLTLKLFNLRSLQIHTGRQGARFEMFYFNHFQPTFGVSIFGFMLFGRLT